MTNQLISMTFGSWRSVENRTQVDTSIISEWWGPVWQTLTGDIRGLFLAVTALAEVGALHRGRPSAQAPTHLGNEKHVVCSHGMSWSQVFGVELKHCNILWPSFPVERELSKQSLGQQRWWDVGFKLGWVPSDDPNRLLAKIWSTQKTKRSLWSLWSLWSLCVCNL